jgi:hypothetical protein
MTLAMATVLGRVVLISGIAYDMVMGTSLDLEIVAATEGPYETINNPRR